MLLTILANIVVIIIYDVMIIIVING